MPTISSDTWSPGGGTVLGEVMGRYSLARENVSLGMDLEIPES